MLLSFGFQLFSFANQPFCEFGDDLIIESEYVCIVTKKKNKSIITEKEDSIIVDIPKGYEFAGVDDDKQQVVFEKIGCQYPKTYGECCEILGIRSDWHCPSF